MKLTHKELFLLCLCALLVTGHIVRAVFELEKQQDYQDAKVSIEQKSKLIKTQADKLAECREQNRVLRYE